MTGSQFDVAVERGQRVVLPEDNYLFGQGTLTLDVTSVGEVSESGGVLWVELRGTQQFPGGPGPHRTVSARLTALQEAARRARP
ncbi:hypothetical protein ACQP2F_14315 [Actinoplanes sp. CA-030573]|uniref:hypothetical protein n=1 Tax=Actinoplanes sp. CA-030573 TaxID=3239898 RepID=UPI003D8E72CA